MRFQKLTTLVAILALAALIAPPTAALAGDDKCETDAHRAQREAWKHLDKRLKGFQKLEAEIAKKSGKKSRKSAKSGKEPKDNRGRGRGGIAPATFPVVDADFLVMVDWTKRQIHAPQAHAIAIGRDVRVAVLDGGFDLDHPDIAGNVDHAAFDAVDMDFDPHDPGNGMDDDWDGIADNGAGHGTFVAGMILMAAPGARIVPIRVRDDEGWGTTQELIRGLLYALTIGVDVINLSLTDSSPDMHEVLDLIDLIYDAGIPVVVSAGNEGQSHLEGLPVRESSLTVTAVDPNDRLAWFANHPDGYAPSVVSAPGVDLYGPMTMNGWNVRGYWSGTSFAAGLVSGAVAVLREYAPGLPARILYKRIMRRTDPAWDEWGNLLPFGRINLENLVR